MIKKFAFGAASALALALTGTAAAAPAGVLAFYNFESGDATDASGNGNDGTAVGGVTFLASGTSYDGSAAARLTPTSGLSGIDTGIDINASVLPAITMGGWINPDSLGTTSVLGKFLSHDNGSFDRTLGFDIRGGTAAAGYSAFTGSGVVDGPSEVALSTWTHLVVSYNGTTVRLYVDGMEVATASDSTDLDTSGFDLFIGTNPGFDEDFDGLVDDVFLYGRELTSAEVMDIFENGFDADPVPVPAAIWLFGAGLAGLGMARRPRS